MRLFCILLLLIGWILEFIFKNNSTVSGIIHIITETILIGCLYIRLSSFKHESTRNIRKFSIFYFIACIIYSTYIYVLHLGCTKDFPLCVIYGIPFNFGLFFLFLFLLEIIKYVEIKFLLFSANLISSIVFILYYRIFVVPNLITADLANSVKILGISYTILSSICMGYSIVLLSIFFSYSIQFILFGILSGFIACIALRTLNTSPTFLGVQVFANIFTISIFLIFYGFDRIKSVALKQKNNIDSVFRSELKSFLPLKSIRGITTVCLFLGFTTQWLIDQFDIIKSRDAVAISSSILHVIVLYGITILAVNLFTTQLSRIAFFIESRNELVIKELKALRSFYEISIILDKFDKLYRAIETNRNEHLEANEFIAHHSLHSLGTIKRVRTFLTERNSPEFMDSIDDLIAVESHLKEVSENISKKCQVDIDSKLIQESVNEAVEQMSRFNPGRKISLEMGTAVDNLCYRVVGLSSNIKNLIQNAIDASSLDSIVHVSVINEENSFTISVRDSGHGMSKDLISKLFSKQHLSLKEYGHGVGISSIIAWAELNQVVFKIYSEPQKGSIMQLIFRKV